MTIINFLLNTITITSVLSHCEHAASTQPDFARMHDLINRLEENTNVNQSRVPTQTSTTGLSNQQRQHGDTTDTSSHQQQSRSTPLPPSASSPRQEQSPQSKTTASQQQLGHTSPGDHSQVKTTVNSDEISNNDDVSNGEPHLTQNNSRVEITSENNVGFVEDSSKKGYRILYPQSFEDISFIDATDIENVSKIAYPDGNVKYKIRGEKPQMSWCRIQFSRSGRRKDKNKTVTNKSKINMSWDYGVSSSGM